MADKITVRLSEGLARRLKVVAVKEGKTVTEIVNGLISSYVAAKESP